MVVHMAHLLDLINTLSKPDMIVCFNLSNKAHHFRIPVYEICDTHYSFIDDFCNKHIIFIYFFKLMILSYGKVLGHSLKIVCLELPPKGFLDKKEGSIFFLSFQTGSSTN